MDRFYTPEIVAKLMVDHLAFEKEPTSAIDICAGSWNLLRTAQNRWPGLNIVGVDTDNDSRLFITNNSTFYCQDGRQFALNSLENNIKFPLVLANPPFCEEKVSAQKEFKALPGFVNMKTHALRRLETTMILANLAILADGGTMAIVVPNTLINGESLRSLRIFIANNYSVTKIIHLPNNVFNREICTSIVFLQATGPTVAKIKIYDAELNISKHKYKTKYAHSIGAKQVKIGTWDNCNQFSNDLTFDFELRRGQISNSDLSYSGSIPVLHNSDISLLGPNWIPTRYVEADSVPGSTAVAEPGDIVITRVGRNCGLFSLYNSKIPLYVSDCIIVLKKSSITASVLEVLNSTDYRQDLELLRRGVNVKYITLTSLREYLNKRLIEIGCYPNDNTETASNYRSEMDASKLACTPIL